MTLAQYPAYDPSAYSTWKIGGLGDGVSAGGYVGMSGTDGGKWALWAVPFALDPGEYLLSEFRFVASLATDANCDAVRFGILQGSEEAVTLATLANGLDYVDMSADRANSSWQAIATDLGDMPFTIESGVSYWMCMGMRGAAGRSNGAPGWKPLDDGVGPQQKAWRSLTGGFLYQSDWSITGLGLLAETVEHPRYQLTVKTKKRIVYAGSYSAATTFYIPRRVGADYWIKFGDAVVADGENLTALLQAEASAAASTKTTLAIDMGATDQMTFGGANVALAAAGAEAGDTFDLGVNVRPVTGKMDLFYRNKTTGQGEAGATEFVTISHACKNAEARAAQYTIADFSWLAISGTAAVASIEVGSEPIVIFGDSQVEQFTTALPAAFTQPRIMFEDGVSGSLLTTAGALRYKHTTPGLGDLCEMTGIVFCFIGYGVNDVSHWIADTEGNRNKFCGLFATKMAEILDDLQDRACHTIVVGLPPYSSATASEQDAQVIKTQLNPMLEGLSIGIRCAYANPWWAMVTPGESENAIPGFSSAYSTDGVHYKAAGVAVVAPMIARAYETGIVGGWWSRRRRSRQSGSLFPV